MRDVFRFWGYHPTTYPRVVGPDRPLLDASLERPTPVFGRVELDAHLIDRCGPLAAECAQGWQTWLAVDREGVWPRDGDAVGWFTDESGRKRTIAARLGADQYVLHFDVDATIEFLQNERYFAHVAPLYVRLGINPERLPGWARKLGFDALSRIRGLRRRRRVEFPARPHDPSVDAWRFLIRSFAEELADSDPIPLWPEGKRYAITLSHDVDTDYAFRAREAMTALRRIEEDAGLRSAWMIVTRYAALGRAALSDLVQSGHEIGCHSTRHDHRLAFLPTARMMDRIIEAAARLSPYGAIGFRSPNYLRTATLYETLSGRFDYDMSMHDMIGDASNLTAANEGCCTCLPFFVAGTDVLEIPTTVPEDWEFELRGVCPLDALTAQVRTIERIKSVGGVANALTHPELNLSLRESWLNNYRELVELAAADDSAWLALPRDVNRHWRERQRTIDALWRGPFAARSLRTAPVSPIDALPR